MAGRGFGFLSFTLFVLFLWTAFPGLTLAEEVSHPATASRQFYGVDDKNPAAIVFRKNVMHVGFGLGAGLGQAGGGPHVAHDLALGRIHWGWIFTNPLFDGHWFSGSLELLGELFGGAQFHPNDRYLFGLTPLLRYNFATSSRWVPFVNGGAGVSYTNIREPDLSTRFQFNLQFGAGTHYFFRRNTAFTLQYRFQHISNAGIESPNNGANTHMFIVGASWFF